MGDVIVEERIIKAERPIKAQIVRVALRKVSISEEIMMILNKAVAESWPSEEVERDGMFCAGLSRARTEPFRDLLELFFCGIKIVLSSARVSYTCAATAETVSNVPSTV